jgi:FdhE protein
MKSVWDQRIARAQELSESTESATDLLALYVRLAALQKNIFEEVTSARETDPAAMARYFPQLREVIARHGPPQANEFIRHRLQSTPEIEELLITYWDDPVTNDVFLRFFLLSLLQPFAESLAGRGQLPRDIAARRCPFCGAPPVAAVLREEGDGGKRLLLCSMCSIEWEFRRVLCPNCGEEDKDKLPVYTSDDLAYVRIEACETCHTYLKGIDMTKNGHAVPVVDELASVSLNVWAEENGYTKAEPNLLGL